MATQVKRIKMEQEGATLQSLNWDLPVQLVGEKVIDPDLLNCCVRCCLPILIYGRLIPCKHVLCLTCAKMHSSSICSKCGDKVTRIEQNPLGTVFVCFYGSSRHGPGGCKRTYLSYRDMEAHVKHRHKKKEPAPPVSGQQMATAPAPLISLAQPPPNMSQPPPHQFMRAPNHMPPIMVNHPPPVITSNVPPPGLPVSRHQSHGQSAPINMSGNTMQPNPHAPLQPIPMQSAPQNSHPQRHPIPINPLPSHHSMIGNGPPPNRPLQSHQQIPGALPPRPHIQVNVRPQQTHNSPAVSSQSHGNLISIPIQGPNWGGQGQQPWSNQGQNNQQQHHRSGQYNN